ncbi:MAG TPA: DUF2058 family protein [Tahibacter sp.]|uniref:DUF2058 family protein n=1 Tax=Tahibacter sp. TaxID=2056211 RepID=UPI002CA04B94|nr:DUF2058 family protein [Tahibacter sp.]HSX62824.1 DUF2058 family protein [Tahibacter sp.]
MADSLRDQLLKSGLVQKLKAEAKPEPKGAGGKPARSDARPGPRPPQGKPPARGDGHRGGPARPQGGGEPDLAQAYALRARTEREERERAQREAEQKAREKRERKDKLARLLNGKALNVADAEHARHFEHGGKIRRVYCTQDQLAALNRGELAIVQQNGRYLIVGSDVGAEVKNVWGEALVLLVDPNAPVEDDVPADLIW